MQHIMDPYGKWDLISHFLQHLFLACRNTEKTIRWKLIFHANQFYRKLADVCVLTAACQINQVCNGPYCRYYKLSKRATEHHLGSWSDQWQAAYLKQMPPIENEGYSDISLWTHMIPWTICFQECIIMMCGNWTLCTRNKHVWNWNAK